MIIADNVIKNRLQNVYFIWGRGKTTVANKLRDRYGYYVYATDEGRERHALEADPAYQPFMCRDYVKEYGAADFWALPPDVIAEREGHWLREFSPMVIADLLVLSRMHGVIICEGDIDYETVIPVASHTVHLSNRGTKFDWFNRPDHKNSLDSVRNRFDLTESEKEAIIKNAYASVGGGESKPPDWVIKNAIKSIAWYDGTPVNDTVSEVAEYFGFLHS